MAGARAILAVAIMKRPATAPRPGDIIIHRETHSPAVYVLSAFNEPHQITLPTLEEALERARRFALRAHLDAWYTTDEHGFERVARHRPED